MSLVAFEEFYRQVWSDERLSTAGRLWALCLASEGEVDTFDMARDLVPGAFPRLCHELRSAGYADIDASTARYSRRWAA